MMNDALDRGLAQLANELATPLDPQLEGRIVAAMSRPSPVRHLSRAPLWIALGAAGAGLSLALISQLLASAPPKPVFVAVTPRPGYQIPSGVATSGPSALQPVAAVVR